MLDAGIADKDLIVVRRQPIAENGDIVVALLSDEATVKRLYIKGPQIELRPENPKFKPIVVGVDDDLRRSSARLWQSEKRTLSRGDKLTDSIHWRNAGTNWRGNAMATLILRRFSRPGILRAIPPARLLTFLKPHRRYFLSRSVDLPLSTASGEFDYESLAKVFGTRHETPKELVDAIYFIDEMSTHEGMDALLAEANKRNLKLPAGSEHSPADIAVQVWLLDKDILERLHAEPAHRQSAILRVLPDGHPAPAEVQVP